MTNTTILFDKAGIPSIMVRIPKFKVSDVIPGGREETHPAFIVDGKEVDEIYISKYQNIIQNGKAYSLPFQQPHTNITIDKAQKACHDKGKGWHLITNAEWAAIALWCKKNGTMPHGNNNWGADYKHKNETAPTFDGCRTYTGTGPNTWSHDHTEDGIHDLNGNIWEMVTGARVVDGQIQIIPNNNAAGDTDMSTDSTEWQPVTSDEKPLYFYDNKDGDLAIGHNKPGTEMCTATEFSKADAQCTMPDTLKELALFPTDETELTEFYGAWLKGENLCYRGGYYDSEANAGVFYCNFNYDRSYSYDYLGFRSAFVNL